MALNATPPIRADRGRIRTRGKTLLRVFGLLVLGGGLAFAVVAEPIPDAGTPAPIVFVCRNGVAMSVWSAAYFNRLAAARGIPERAIARAAIPSFRAVPFSMAFALAIDGFRLDGYEPRVVDVADVRGAALVVAIDTALPSETAAEAGRSELWDGFPPMRERYFPSRTALKARVEALVERLAANERAPCDSGASSPDCERRTDTSSGEVVDGATWSTFGIGY